MMIEKAAKVLIVTAVEAERGAILQGIGDDGRFDVIAAGVGPIAAAVATARQLAEVKYDLVLSAGIGGGFPERADVGSIVIADRIIAADLGAETESGFHTVDELGFGHAEIRTDLSRSSRWVEALREKGHLATLGPVLTCSTVTGTAETAAELRRRVPGAVAEAMEGFGVAYAAADRAVPVLEMRTISNLVGPRDRSSWRIAEALSALTVAGAILKEVV